MRRLYQLAAIDDGTRGFWRIQVGVVESGTMSFYCQSTTHIVPTGTVLLLSLGEVHAPKAATDKGWSFRMFYLEKEFFQARSEDFGSGVPQFVKPFVRDKALAASLLRLHRKLETDADTLNIEHNLACVFSQLNERHICDQRNQSPIRNEHDRIRDVKDYLRSFYSRAISVEDLTEIAQLSRFHLMRTFRRDVGLSPYAYLTQVRVEAAEKLLSKGVSIVDEASEIGFTDQSHFPAFQANYRCNAWSVSSTVASLTCASGRNPCLRELLIGPSEGLRLNHEPEMCMQHLQHRIM